jgi:hypothetical protein
MNLKSSPYRVLPKSCSLTDKVCEIDSFEPLRDQVIDGAKPKNQPKMIKKLLKNNYQEYYHWLPIGINFPGGFINFRKGISVRVENFEKVFKPPEIQVSAQFIKDIVHRFSAFYARQGQPDFFFDELAEYLLPKK